ncbi:hypothetical protein M422DRAFT_241444 [Sphaerobolus stellatus SS14]|nr:hypothetical protein M422DRAFT_241444 [Sphaerobolus stellatus SS14]
MSGSQLPFFEPLADLSPHAISARVFPFATKRRRQRDLLVLEQQSESSASGSVDVCLYANPFEDGGSKPLHWQKLKIATLLNPLTIAYADISKNGYNDVIVIDQNRAVVVVVLTRREIGRVHTRGILKVGHFTNNFSLQILVIPVSQSTGRPQTNSDSSSLFILYTQPPNISSARQWLTSIALHGIFHQVSDVHILAASNQDAQGGLDKILIASKEGVSLVWWEKSKWQSRNISLSARQKRPPLDLHNVCTTIAIGRASDDIAYIACCEGKALLTILVRSATTRHLDVQRSQWSRILLDDSFDFPNISITQILCKDIDGDGIDEVIINVACSDNIFRTELEGLWYYRAVDLQEGVFHKHRIVLDRSVSEFEVDDMTFTNKMLRLKRVHLLVYPSTTQA